MIEKKEITCQPITKLFDFITEKQLKNSDLWKRFTEVFEQKLDSADLGWRGEYWGKMMRGACQVYECSHDESAYHILSQTVEDILAVQEENGRISSYQQDNEFVGWDMWCRKYVLVGLEYFYQVCHEPILKNRILSAMKSSVDYILEYIGKNKKHIFETSSVYGGVNSCSILEPIVELYKLTGEYRYLEFAEYILSTGGCQDGNLLNCVNNDNCYPYQYPETKIYETMSFFEGVLAYGEATNQKEYVELVARFVDDVICSDLTVLGSCGCRCEHFDNSTVTQTLETGYLMQETCVTVTWLRLLNRLYKNTSNIMYQDLIEKAYYNAFLGSFNELEQDIYCVEIEEYIKDLPFYCYSPLMDDIRTRQVSGCKQVKDIFYSCCSAIGGAGISVLPTNRIFVKGEAIVINQYLSGREDFLYGDNLIGISFETEYPANGKVKLTINLQREEMFTLKLRIPQWSNNALITVAGETFCAQKGYYQIERMWRDGDIILLDFPLTLTSVMLDEKYAFSYGCIILAADEAKSAITNIPADFHSQELLPLEGELCRFALECGKNERLILTNYSSCGKNSSSKISVWLKGEGICLKA